MTNLYLLLTRIYQLVLSPTTGLIKSLYFAPGCRFYPTCSEYSRQAVKKRGLFVGLYLSLVRLLKCHPWHELQIDEVPN